MGEGAAAMSEYQQRDRDVGSVGTGTDREKDPADIEREIEMTRQRMTQDIDAIGNKLNPRNLAAQAKEAAQEKARRTGRGFISSIRENPLPAAAVGASVAWFWSQARSNNEEDWTTRGGSRYGNAYYSGQGGMDASMGNEERWRRGADWEESGPGRLEQAKSAASRAAHNVADKARDLTGQAKEKASELGSHTKDRAQHLGGAVRQRSTDARHTIERQTRENPLMVAAFAAVAGLALGMLLPGTRRENELMGGVRDDVADRAGEVVNRVKEAASEGAQQVKETVKSEVRDRGPEVKQVAQDIAQQVKTTAKDSASNVAQEAKDAAKTSGRKPNNGMV
jgi:ElaB/YqjD/DUF883 family membrane-anchored ribosome-binding protein